MKIFKIKETSYVKIEDCFLKINHQYKTLKSITSDEFNQKLQLFRALKLINNIKDLKEDLR